MWKRDGKCLFDQLSLAPALRAYMGRPSCFAGELCDVTDIRLSELSRYCTGPGRLERTTNLVPAGCVWAMGFGWSWWVAQSTMLSTCRAAGLHEEMLLAEDLPPPQCTVTFLLPRHGRHGLHAP